MNRTGNITPHFTWEEATYLPKWDRLADESDGLNPIVEANLRSLFAQMETVREFFGKPIVVHVAYRPQKYNALVGGAKDSAHMAGLAVDFHVMGLNCDQARDMILKNHKLDEWGMRMENNPGSDWIHLDLKPVPEGGHRFFKP